jgi:hypothetical protein
MAAAAADQHEVDVVSLERRMAAGRDRQSKNHLA